MAIEEQGDAGRSGLTPVLERNIEALMRRRKREEKTAAWQQRAAHVITRFTGSMTFVVLHVVVFGLWIVVNLGLLPGLPVWDPEFVKLAMVASVEAIFLSTFVLISQNRMAEAADKRADLDLQVSLLAEHEITALVRLVAQIAEAVGVRHGDELKEAKRDISPEKVLDKLERRER
ncbi:DUF1003 domain-containing protein [Xanthobacteraceae bacterium Astr-EGSB]|uniref:DUF1003 domain-containing protein n=1 Tax=Astrobacterium formosum TaxID=3069710 RepID=UPI0027B09CB3|nr:DUF1003 domain-containing protein [Xanthobacteraceae bacterium Astr-EGSB]